MSASIPTISLRLSGRWVIMTSRYLLFSGETYYARGGWHDGATRFNTLEAACETGEQRIAEPCSHDWWHVVDLETGKIIAKSAEQAHGVDW